jgi:putative transposase
MEDRMKRSRYTEEQIIATLKEAEAGRTIAELCREKGISEGTFFNWRKKYGGMEVSEAKRLKQLEEENRRLKQLLAESVLDNHALKVLLGKNS